jgi:hypothetical protein
MSLSCPVCRAKNDIGPSCRRCRADLSLCFAVERQRECAIVTARRAAAQGDLTAAFAHVARGAQLRAGHDLTKLRAALHVLQGEFAHAWYHVRTLNEAGS